MIQKLNHNGLGFNYFFCHVDDFDTKVDVLYDERGGNPAFKTVWVETWQWEIPQEDENGDPLPPIIYTPSLREVVDYLGYTSPLWRDLNNPDSLYQLITCYPFNVAGGQIDPLYNNLGDGTTPNFFLGYTAEQMKQVAEPVPSEI